jgi:O-Antigen ligase
MTVTASPTKWESKLALRLELLVSLLGLLVVCRIAFTEDISWIVWLLPAAAVLLLSVFRWPYGVLLILIGASAMPRIAVGLFGWNARPEHFAAALVAPCVAIWMLYSKRGIQLDKMDYWVLAYVLVNYISSAFGSSEPSATLRWALQNNLAALSYFLIRLLVNDQTKLKKAFRILMGIGIAEVVYGILCYLSHNLFGTTGGVEVGAYLVDVAAPFGTMYEPNLFGAYSGCVAVLFLAQYLADELRRTAYMVGFVVASLATVSSFSRGALLALVISIGWLFWRTRHVQAKSPNRLIIFVLGLGLILGIAASAAGGILQERLSTLYYQGLTEGNTISRVLVIQEAIQDLPKHPLLGSGTASFNLSFDWAEYIPEWTSDKTWIANAPLRILHDTGLLGLTAFCGFLVSLWLRIRRDLQAANGGKPILLGLSAGALLYGISFQLTDGTILAFSWVHLGFLASAAILLKPSGEKANTPGAAVRIHIPQSE